MSILWCGGEDIDFPNGTAPTVNTTAGNFRSNYARCAVAKPASGCSTSNIFESGAVTSCWVSVQIVPSATTLSNDYLLFGLGLFGTVKGLMIGTGDSTAAKITLWKYDGTTKTALAVESGASWTQNGLVKIDIRLQNYGADAIVDVYLNGESIIHFEGDTTVTGMTNVDCVAIWNSNMTPKISEVIVADEDTRTFSLMTMAPNGDGTTTDWTGASTDVDEITNSDADVNTTNTVDINQQLDLVNLTAGGFSPRACKIAARATATADATATKVALGINDNGNINEGTLVAPGTSWITLERLMLVNPYTTNPWQQSEMDGLQINLHSGS